MEAGSTDPNHVENVAVKGEHAANGVGSTAKMFAPEAVAQDRNRRTAAIVV